MDGIVGTNTRPFIVALFIVLPFIELLFLVWLRDPMGIGKLLTELSSSSIVSMASFIPSTAS
jgi:UPF0716 family protein affecting phage T7 exclusion